MSIETEIRSLADLYDERLKNRMAERENEMKADDKSHYLIYQVLGVSKQEGHLIDLYQNKGRFLYRYAGAFLEDATKLCFKATFPEGDSLKIPNTIGIRPKTFEIDCLIDTDAYEIKWRDATTDGDHVTKEHTRIKVIVEAGYTPVRLMFYYPNRKQAIRIQELLEDLYRGVGGVYYYGEKAWLHVEEKTGINLKAIIEKIAEEKLND